MKKVLLKPSLSIVAKNAILEAIKEGEIAQNDRLPSEEALAEMFSVSRTTIRNALQSLENDGLINRRHGTEATVSRICLGLNMRIDKAKGFIDLITASGYTAESVYRTLERQVLDSKVANKLQLDKDSDCLVLTELLSGDGNPVIFLKEYYPDSIISKMPDLEDIPQDIYKLSDLYFRKPISYTIREISAVRDSEILLKSMQLQSGTGLIKMEETHYSDDNIPIAYNETFIRDSIIKLQIVCKRMS